MDQFDLDLDIPDHRPGARFASIVAAVLILAGLLLLISSRLDNDRTFQPVPGEGSTTTTVTAPSTTTSTVVIHAAAFTGNIAEYHQPPITPQMMDTDPGLITVQGEVYEVDAPNRPACWVEPQNTEAGYGVTFYSDLADVDDSGFGFEVSCPEPGEFPNAVHCQEDEIATVAYDPNPDHGLTWRCVNAEQYEQGERP